MYGMVCSMLCTQGMLLNKLPWKVIRILVDACVDFFFFAVCLPTFLAEFNASIGDELPWKVIVCTYI